MTRTSRPLVIGFDDLLLALWRQKLLILLVGLSTALAAYGVASLLPSRYAAEGLLVVDNRQITIPELQTAIAAPLAEPQVVQTELTVLRSRSLAEQVVRELELHKHPVFIKKMDDEEIEPVAAAVSVLQEEFWAKSAGDSYAIEVGFFSHDPQLAAQVVNTLMDTYINNQVIANRRGTAEANQWLAERLIVLRQSVERADERAQQYRTEHRLVETREGTLTEQRLIEANRQLSEARAALAESEARHRRTADVVGAGGFAAATSDVLASEQIQTLSEQEALLLQRQAELAVELGPRHPQLQTVEAELADVRRTISAELDRALRALNSEVEVARSRVRSFESEVAALERRSTETALAYAKLMQLQRDADAARDLYRTLFERVEQTSTPTGIKQADARIVSRAVPMLLPVSPQVKMVSAFGLLGGLLLGGVVALLLHRFDDRFRTLDDLCEATGLSPLGAVPAVPSSGRRENALLVHVASHPNSAASETIRGIRVNYKHSTAKTIKSLLVTSALPNDGKTAFAVALGQISACDGQKVLVIDCDLRKPSLLRTFDLATPHGLEDVLTEAVAWQEVVLRCDSGLYCLPARGGAGSPQQLLETYCFETVLAEAGQAFDLVILDSPPVMLVSDAIVLANHVDAIALVVSWNRTRRRAVSESVKRLQGSGREVGVVLSRVRGHIPGYQVYGGYEREA